MASKIARLQQVKAPLRKQRVPPISETGGTRSIKHQRFAAV